jgi:hypothetical protein
MEYYYKESLFSLSGNQYYILNWETGFVLVPNHLISRICIQTYHFLHRSIWYSVITYIYFLLCWKSCRRPSITKNKIKLKNYYWLRFKLSSPRAYLQIHYSVATFYFSITLVFHITSLFHAWHTSSSNKRVSSSFPVTAIIPKINEGPKQNKIEFVRQFSLETQVPNLIEIRSVLSDVKLADGQTI